MIGKPTTNFEETKQRARNLALELLSEIDKCTEFDITALEEVSKGITKAKHLLVSMKKHKVLESLEVKLEVKAEPWNKKIDQQRRFRSTKASKLEKPKLRMSKPTVKERLNFLRDPLWNPEDASVPTESSSDSKQNDEPATDVRDPDSSQPTSKKTSD